MRKWVAMAGVSLALVACGSVQEQHTVTGAALGGAAGAVIGGVASNSVGGALAGGAIGAVAGGLIGNATSPRRCYYNRYGQRRCVVY